MGRRRGGERMKLPATAVAPDAALPPPSSLLPPTDWSHTPERSNLFALRFVCWFALTCGRRTTRWLLPPISLYFLLFSPVQRRNIKRYLFRAVGPKAGWIDGYKLLHAFASTVLDRVYFLRGRMDLFDVKIEGNRPVEAEALAGRGAFLLGAHIGSFEALGACRSQSLDHTELRAAMLMFADNAQRISAMLDAISLPELRPHVIALGRPNSMLALRDWLDTGGMAGLLADRTLPGQDESAAKRGNGMTLPFLGHPTVFNDGPFRLAAMLRRRVYFMAGLYGGGARYDVSFEPLADFTERLTDPAEREARIQAALVAYVERLEVLCRAYPYNWFNFHDFWLEDARSPQRP